MLVVLHCRLICREKLGIFDAPLVLHQLQRLDGFVEAWRLHHTGFADRCAPQPSAFRPLGILSLGLNSYSVIDCRRARDQTGDRNHRRINPHPGRFIEGETRDRLGKHLRCQHRLRAK